MAKPTYIWSDLLKRSAGVREISSRWLFQTKNRRAQDLRLRVRLEQDAFARMTSYWQRLGFIFDRLVASLATAMEVRRIDRLRWLINQHHPHWWSSTADVARSAITLCRRYTLRNDFQAQTSTSERVMEPIIAQLFTSRSG